MELGQQGEEREARWTGRKLMCKVQPTVKQSPHITSLPHLGRLLGFSGSTHSPEKGWP